MFSTPVSVEIYMLFRFLFRFTGDDSEIALQGDGTENTEFSEWKWVSIEEVVKNAWLLTTNLHTRAPVLQLTVLHSVYKILIVYFILV